VRGLSQREIHRRTGLHRDTIRNAIKQQQAAEVRARAGRLEAGSVHGADPSTAEGPGDQHAAEELPPSAMKTAISAGQGLGPAARPGCVRHV
jgi:hypothetical protein